MLSERICYLNHSISVLKKILKKNTQKKKKKITRLRNKFLKDQNKQQKKVFKTKKLLCITYKKDEKRLLQYLRCKKVTDDKNFWKTMKPFQSEKILLTERITLIDNGEVVPTEQESTLVLNTFFSNIVTNLSDPRFYLKNNCKI